MTVVDQLQQATDGAATMIAALRPDELARPTPNDGWDVRAMLNHMIYVNKNFAFTVSGEGSRPTPDADHVGGDPASSYRATAASALAAWRRPGALEGTVTMASGESPAAPGLWGPLRRRPPARLGPLQGHRPPLPVRPRAVRGRFRDQPHPRHSRPPRSRQALWPRGRLRRGRPAPGPPGRVSRPPTIECLAVPGVNRGLTPGISGSLGSA